MKNNLLVIIVIISSILSCKKDTAKREETRLSLKSNLAIEIDQYFSTLSNLGKFNGVIYAIKDNQEVINKAYNIQLDKRNSLYVSKVHQFDIHSVSKLMARYIITKYELQGKLRRKQVVDDFIRGFPKGDKITIDMLLNHTSGLPRSLMNVKINEIDLTTTQIIEYAKKQKFLFEPGTGSQYSNVGYQIIYEILATISKKTFAQCLIEEVFHPLDMKNSGAHFYTKEKNIQNLAKNHEKQETKIVQVANILEDELRTARIYSNAKDLNIFLNHIKKEEYASVLKNDENIISQSGGGDGIRVQVYTSLNHNYNYVLLSNYDQIPFKKTIEDFSKMLESKPYKIPKEIDRKSIRVEKDILQKYVGVYSFADLNHLELIFEVSNNNLLVYEEGEEKEILKAETVTVFFADPKEAESFEFTVDKNKTPIVWMGWKGVKLKGVKK